MEAVIIGLVAYHVILLRAVKICNERNFGLGKSFILGVVAGGIFLLTVYAIGYYINREIVLINGDALSTFLVAAAILVLGGVRCMEGRKRGRD